MGTKPHLNKHLLPLKYLSHVSWCKGSAVSMNLKVAFTLFHQLNHHCWLLMDVPQPSSPRAGLVSPLQHSENSEVLDGWL